MEDIPTPNNINSTETLNANSVHSKQDYLLCNRRHLCFIVKICTRSMIGDMSHLFINDSYTP